MMLRSISGLLSSPCKKRRKKLQRKLDIDAGTHMRGEETSARENDEQSGTQQTETINDGGASPNTRPEKEGLLEK